MNNSNDIIRIENVFSPSVLEMISKDVSSHQIGWGWSEDAAYLDEQTENFEDHVKTPAFGKVVFLNGASYDRLSFTIQTAFLNALDRVNQKMNELYRIRLGLIIPKVNFENKTIFNHISGPHVDLVTKHKTALIYLTTCDAPTYLYKQFYDNSYKKDPYAFLKIYLEEKLDIECKIPSVENTGVLFDGHRYHSSSTPTDVERRLVITINYS